MYINFPFDFIFFILNIIFNLLNDYSDDIPHTPKQLLWELIVVNFSIYISELGLSTDFRFIQLVHEFQSNMLSYIV